MNRKRKHTGRNAGRVILRPEVHFNDGLIGRSWTRIDYVRKNRMPMPGACPGQRRKP